MANEIQNISCGNCAHVLSAEQIEKTSHDPCPECGSTVRHIKLELFDTVSATARDTFKAKLKDPSKTGKQKVRREIFSGADRRVSKGDWVHKERDIDRDNDRYREIVREEDTGEIIHEADEPLSKHFGHGSAKFKPPKV